MQKLGMELGEQVMGCKPMDFRTTSAAAPIVRKRSGNCFLVKKVFFVEVVRIGRFVSSATGRPRKMW